MKLYVSHSARKSDNSVEWFIVQPIEYPDKQVASLRQRGRSVYALDVEPGSAKSTQLEPKPADN